MNYKHSMDPELQNQFNQQHADLNEKLKERSNYNLSQGTKVVSKVVSNKYSVNNDDLKDGAFYTDFFVIISIYFTYIC